MSSVEGWLEIINICASFCILCKYFTINVCTSQSEGICWNPVGGLCEARSEPRTVLDGQHTTLPRAPPLAQGDASATPHKLLWEGLLWFPPTSFPTPLHKTLTPIHRVDLISRNFKTDWEGVYQHK